MKPEPLLAAGYHVVTNLLGNTNYPNTPVDLDLLKIWLDAFHVSIGEAKDGSKRAILRRNEQGENIRRALQHLVNYVEIQCKGDMNVFLSSGFQPRARSRPSLQPLAQPSIAELAQGPSGTLLTWINGVGKAKNYECRFGIVGPVVRHPLLGRR